MEPVVVAVESVKRSVLSKRSVFSMAIMLPRMAELMSIVSAAGQHGPGDAGYLLAMGDDHFVAWSSLIQPVHPLS
jgi:hypothetical protein